MSHCARIAAGGRCAARRGRLYPAATSAPGGLRLAERGRGIAEIGDSSSEEIGLLLRSQSAIATAGHLVIVGHCGSFLHWLGLGLTRRLRRLAVAAALASFDTPSPSRRRAMRSGAPQNRRFDPNGSVRNSRCSSGKASPWGLQSVRRCRGQGAHISPLLILRIIPHPGTIVQNYFPKLKCYQ